MSRYDVAQICLNGHVITSYYRDEHEDAKNFCDECGKPTIINCQKCESPIRGGDLEMPSDLLEAPAFCDNCGEPYPWTKTKIEAAKELAQELENISQEEKDILSKSIDDLVSDTPKTPLAVSRFKRIMRKAGDVAWKEMKSILVDAMSETAKKAMFGP